MIRQRQDWTILNPGRHSGSGEDGGGKHDGGGFPCRPRQTEQRSGDQSAHTLRQDDGADDLGFPQSQRRRRLTEFPGDGGDTLHEGDGNRGQNHKAQQDAAGQPAFPSAQKLHKHDHSEITEEDGRHAVQNIQQQRQGAAPLWWKIDAVQ